MAARRQHCNPVAPRQAGCGMAGRCLAPGRAGPRPLLRGRTWRGSHCPARAPVRGRCPLAGLRARPAPASATRRRGGALG